MQVVLEDGKLADGWEVRWVCSGGSNAQDSEWHSDGDDSQFGKVHLRVQRTSPFRLAKFSGGCLC